MVRTVMSVPSPCIHVCHIDVDAGYCSGCRRTLDEICDWGTMTDDERRATLARVAERAREEASAARTS
jgi:predicted Fe-S protein YdhL (DUF1289 family)